MSRLLVIGCGVAQKLLFQKILLNVKPLQN